MERRGRKTQTGYQIFSLFRNIEMTSENIPFKKIEEFILIDDLIKKEYTYCRRKDEKKTSQNFK